MNELFLESSMHMKSPSLIAKEDDEKRRELWMKKNDIHSAKNGTTPLDDPWECWVGSYHESVTQTIEGHENDPSLSPVFTTGVTEMDAIKTLATNRKIALW